MEKRICNYRRCSNDLEGMRKDAKYCCMSCRKMEQTYRKRKKVLIEKYKKDELLKVENYKNLLKIVKEEYKK